MGDCQTEPFRLQFDRRPRLQFQGATLVSDAGLLAYRELDDALDLTSTAASRLEDARTGQNSQHGLTRLFSRAIYNRPAGYGDIGDFHKIG